MASKTQIKNRTWKKTNTSVISTVLVATKNKAWMPVAQILSSSTKAYSSVNLDKLERETKAGDTVIIPGKVLSSGKLTKKLRICALGFSAGTLIKLKESKSEAVSILDEINSNPKATGIKIIR